MVPVLIKSLKEIIFFRLLLWHQSLRKTIIMLNLKYISDFNIDFTYKLNSKMVLSDKIERVGTVKSSFGLLIYFKPL